MITTKLAYLAGLIDGEGTVGLYLKNQRKDFSLRVAIYNTNETLMEWLLFNCGGLRHRVGRRLKPNHQQELCWYLSSQKARDLLVDVLPYLVIKKAKTEIAIEAWDNRKPTPRCDRLKPMSPEVILWRQEYVDHFKATAGACREN